MFKLNYNGTDGLVIRARAIIEQHIQDTAFRTILHNATFTLTEDRKPDISILILDKQIWIHEYKSINPWSKVNAYYDGESIWINTRKNPDLLTLVKTITHEIFHSMGYKHKGNKKTAFNLLTVPYQGSLLFVAYLKDKGVL
jgi:hypothetical protein